MIFVIGIVSFFASLLTFFSGFGLGTVLMPVVAIFFPVTVAVALTALVHLLSNLFKLMVLWKDINWHVAFTFGIPALLATIPGALILIHLEELPAITTYVILEKVTVITPIKLMIGILLILFAALEGCDLAKKINTSLRYLPIGGILSGFFGGLSGHQGAFRSAFLLHVNLDKNQFVATNAAIASFVDMSRLVIYSLSTVLLLEQVNISLIAVATAAAFSGVIAGKIGLRKVTIGLIRKIITILLYIIGLLLCLGII